MAQQTSVQWFLIEIGKYMDTWNIPDEVIEQAKEMHKEEMHKCASFWRGKENDIEKNMFEKYYNETYKK
jgi:hypothetical protein